MKILWFTITPIHKLGNTASGTWLSSMFNGLLIKDHYELVNIAISQNAMTSQDSGNSRIILSKNTGRQKPNEKLIQAFIDAITEIQPDLVHIWGTEWNGAYIASKAQLNIPVLISIQGIAFLVKNYVKGSLKMIQIIRWITLHDLIGKSGLISLYRNLRQSGEMEKQSIKEHKLFECATPFMEAWVRSINPKARIFSCPSVLRYNFYHFKWSLNKCIRHSLFLPDACTSYKGFDVMLRAAKILIKEFPNLQIRVAGNKPRKGLIRASGFERYIIKLIKNKDLNCRVTFLGPLPSDSLCQEMILSNAVVISSLIESQSLVLLESMMLGVPSIASYSGGMPDLFSHLNTAIGYQASDHVTLAHSIRRIFNDDPLAIKISQNAFQLAHLRNDSDKCIKNMENIYNQILGINLI